MIGVTGAELELEQFVIHCIYFYTLLIPWLRMYNSAVMATCSVLYGKIALEYPEKVA